MLILSYELILIFYFAINFFLAEIIAPLEIKSAISNNVTEVLSPVATLPVVVDEADWLLELLVLLLEVCEVVDD